MTNWQDLAYRFRWQIALLLVGAILAAGGTFLSLNKSESKFEVVKEETKTKTDSELVVEVSGAVERPGVYRIMSGGRVEDAIQQAGGLSADANANWIEKYLNRAANVTDGQKIYIPWQTDSASAEITRGEQSATNVLAEESSGFVNINTASQEELESLYGIGPVYAKKIIDNRPYSNVEELLVKKVISQKIYDDNSNLLTVY